MCYNEYGNENECSFAFLYFAVLLHYISIPLCIVICIDLPNFIQIAERHSLVY